MANFSAGPSGNSMVVTTCTSQGPVCIQTGEGRQLYVRGFQEALTPLLPESMVVRTTVFRLLDGYIWSGGELSLSVRTGEVVHT